MKFCKQLEKTIDHSDPEWHAFWINYKLLKKKLKEVPRFGGTRGNCSTTNNKNDDEVHHQQGAPPAAAHSGTSGSETETVVGEGVGKRDRLTSMEQIKALSRSPDEAAFFRLVAKEVRKTRDFFESVEAQFVIRLGHVRDGMKLIDMDTVMAKNQDSWVHMMAACVQLYKDLLRLENYAIVTWTGFSKIIKKFDKRTGYCTRPRFMLNVVNKQPFTHYPRLSKMLEEVEETYQRVQKIRECTHFSSQSLKDELLFIETVRGINKEVSKIQRAEDDGGNLNPNKKPRKEGEEDRGSSRSPSPPLKEKEKR